MEKEMYLGEIAIPYSVGWTIWLMVFLGLLEPRHRFPTTFAGCIVVTVGGLLAGALSVFVWYGIEEIVWRRKHRVSRR